MALIDHVNWSGLDLLVTHQQRNRSAHSPVISLFRWWAISKTLPADYVGERHVVIVKREPAGAPGKFEWCEFEERPGPAPVDAQEEGRYHDMYRVSGSFDPPGWKPQTR